MPTTNPSISSTWTELAPPEEDFLLTLPFATRFDVDVATTDDGGPPSIGRGHILSADLRSSISRALIGPGTLWAKAPGYCTAALSTWNTDLLAILAMTGIVGYWPADASYLYADDAGTTLASVDGAIAYQTNLVTGGAPAVQTTADDRPVLRKYSTASIYWVETVGADNLTATLGDLGTTCTVVTVDGDSVTFTEDVTIADTYNITPVVGYNSDIAIFNRALTADEKVVLTRYLSRTYTLLQQEVLAIANLVGYWPADPAYLWEDSGGATPASLNGVVGRWDSIGTPAIQATTAVKPYLRRTPTSNVYWLDSNTSTSALNVALSDTVLGRRNLLIQTEDFSNVAWSRYAGGTGSLPTITANYGLAPDGTQTADRIQLALNGGGTTSDISRIGQDNSNTAQKTISFYIKSLSGSPSIFIIDVSNSSYRKLITVTPDWQRVDYTPPTGANGTLGLQLRGGWGGSDSADLLVWGGQLELGATATDYQKITSVPAYCTVARATAEGVTFSESAEITPSYNIAPAFGFNGDIAIFDRALTATEKALLTRYMSRGVPVLGSNLITDSGFDNPSAWTHYPAGYITVSGGVADIVGGISDVAIGQTHTLPVGTAVYAKCEAVRWSLGYLRLGVSLAAAPSGLGLKSRVFNTTSDKRLIVYFSGADMSVDGFTAQAIL